MTMLDPLILLVEDEAPLRKFLRASLADGGGYRLLEAETASQGLALARSHNPDLVLLDLGLPDLDGTEMTKQLRRWGKTPIVIISARGQETDKVAALDAGADDYLTKPFGTGELKARIRVALRHAAGAGSDEIVLSAGDIRLDLEKRRVTVADVETHLTPTEYKLLTVLMRSVGKVLTHRQLLIAVWGPAYASQTQYLRVYMGQLRHKLEADPARPRHLATEPGVGYRFNSE